MSRINDVMVRNDEVIREYKTFSEKLLMRLSETTEEMIRQKREFEKVIERLEKSIYIKDEQLKEYRGDK